MCYSTPSLCLIFSDVKSLLKSFPRHIATRAIIVKQNIPIPIRYNITITCLSALTQETHLFVVASKYDR